MKTFVVTGATGFIGGELARQLHVGGLRESARVVALCRDGDPPDGCEIVRGDIEDLRTCERIINEAQPDGVFHLAAQALVERARRDPFGTMESNIRGTYNMLEAFRRHRKSESRMVVASSDKAYGELPKGSDAYQEGMPLEGRGPYDVSKTCTDLIAQSYQLSYSLPIAIIRAGNVYGPEDRDLSRIVPSLCDDVLNRRPLTVRSDGSPVREYLHVSDVAKGYVAAFEKNGLGAYNLGTGTSMSVMELVEEFVRMLRAIAASPYGHYASSFKYDVVAYLDHYSQIDVLGTRAGEIQRQVLDPTRARTELKWEAKQSLNFGLEETFIAAWQRRQR